MPASATLWVLLNRIPAIKEERKNRHSLGYLKHSKRQKPKTQSNIKSSNHLSCGDDNDGVCFTLRPINCHAVTTSALPLLATALDGRDNLMTGRTTRRCSWWGWELRFQWFNFSVVFPSAPLSPDGNANTVKFNKNTKGLLLTLGTAHAQRVLFGARKMCSFILMSWRCVVIAGNWKVKYIRRDLWHFKSNTNRDAQERSPFMWEGNGIDKMRIDNIILPK